MSHIIRHLRSQSRYFWIVLGAVSLLVIGLPVLMLVPHVQATNPDISNTIVVFVEGGETSLGNAEVSSYSFPYISGVAGKRYHLEALPLAVQIADDQSQSVRLRMSAIATIAHLHGTEHQALLTSLSQSSDSRLRSAAESALQNFPRTNSST